MTHKTIFGFFMITAHSTPISQDPLLPVAGRDMLARLTCDISATSRRHSAVSPDRFRRPRSFDASDGLKTDETRRFENHCPQKLDGSSMRAPGRSHRVARPKRPPAARFPRKNPRVLFSPTVCRSSGRPVGPGGAVRAFPTITYRAQKRTRGQGTISDF